MLATLSSLLNLPPELILTVFDALRNEGDWCTATCLGLASMYLYRTYKERYHPKPISLAHFVKAPPGHSFTPVYSRRDVDQAQTYDALPLYTLLKDFIGPDYRLLRDSWPPLYVSLGLYDDDDDAGKRMAQRLAHRRWDYNLMMYRSWPAGEMNPLLANPFNKGSDWYHEVFERIIEHEKLGWTTEMLEYWRRNIGHTYIAASLSPKRRWMGTKDDLFLDEVDPSNRRKRARLSLGNEPQL